MKIEEDKCLNLVSKITFLTIFSIVIYIVIDYTCPEHGKSKRSKTPELILKKSIVVCKHHI